MLYALLFLPALVGIAYVAVRARKARPDAEPALVVAHTVAPPPSISGQAVPEAVDPFDTLETLLAELERITLDERDVADLEQLAEELERTARDLERAA